jgi:hypothetical protein
MNIKRRLERLERLQSKECQTSERPSAVPWDLLCRPVNELTAEDAEILAAFYAAAEAEHSRRLEEHPAGRIYRRELSRLGQPQPATLASIDVIEEGLRLASIPTPKCAPGVPKVDNGLNASSNGTDAYQQ